MSDIENSNHSSAQPPTASGNSSVVYLGMGCFWGAEKKLWQLPGVVATRVGYQGGTTANPDYTLVCTGSTGHAEIVEVSYDPALVSLYDVLKVFWENHDPTQGDRQGGDIGTQYRSAVFYVDPADLELINATRAAYEAELSRRGFDPITTQIAWAQDPARPLKFWPAEEYHQKYLQKNPDGYDCHAHTGIDLPSLAECLQAAN